MNRTPFNRKLYYRIKNTPILGWSLIILTIRLKVMVGGNYEVIPE